MLEFIIGHKNIKNYAEIQLFALALFVLISTFADSSVQVLSIISEIRQHIHNAKSTGKIVGLVPTMGALHQGHASLIERARAESDVVIVSIFVNPTQFNEQQDFQNYPRTMTSDLDLLEKAGCDIAFVPDHSEVYPTPDRTEYNFKFLESRLEGALRPGHFRGVAMVVRRFFEIVTPHKAYFGLKDYQQVMVIKSLVKQYDLKVEIVTVPTVREEDGLAMSSRNRLLSPAHRAKAAEVYRVLKSVRETSGNSDIAGLTEWAEKEINQHPELQLEYFDIADPDTLEPISDLRKTPHALALIAVRAGQIRLIDNLQLF